MVCPRDDRSRHDVSPARRGAESEPRGEEDRVVVVDVLTGWWTAAPVPPVPQPSQCCHGQHCTMRRPRHPRPPLPDSSQPVPWLLLLLRMTLVVCLFARPCVSASAGAKGKGGGGNGGGGGGRVVCGTRFTDLESSALLADVVLEGRVREKVFPKDSPRPPASGGHYNVSIQLRKQVWKGRELINKGKKARKLLLGTFMDAPSSPAKADNGDDGNNNIVNDDARVLDDGGDVGGLSSVESCVGQVQDGGTYIFFLREAGDRKGRYFQLSALPVKKNRRDSRKVSKILRKNAAQKPSIQRLKGPRKVTMGSSLTLRCKAKAKPPALYSWFCNGQPLKSGRGLRIKSNKRGSRLKISKIKGSSAGVYTCMAANALGEASKNVTVKVVEAESIHKPCEKQTFCFNGGSCRYLPELQQTFCQCPKRWAGRRCELLDPLSVGLDPDSLNRAASLEYERILIIVGIVIAFLVFVVICIASYFLAKRRRQRWETRRRMKQTAAHERERLLDQTNGNRQPRGFPMEKETQTDDLDPPNLPPKREPGHRPNFIHNTPTSSETPFHMDDHFPVITSAASPVFTSQASGGPNGRKAARPGSGRESRELERRESRSRLKAVSVDDSCTERPPSWRADGEGPGRESQHPLTGCPEVIEMNDLSSQPSNTSSPNDESQVDGLPGFLSSFSSSGPGDELIRMETLPKDNAHAQLKTPDEQSTSPPSAVSDYDVPKSVLPLSPDFPKPEDAEMPPYRHIFAQPSKHAVLPVNGAVGDWESENEDGDKSLPPLHISEEDLNGNLSKVGSLDSSFLPRVPVRGYSSEEASSPGSCSTPPLIVADHRPRNQPPVMVDGVGVDGHFQDSCEDDCGGFLPHAVKGSAVKSSRSKDPYSFDPALDSDPDDMEQFMHGSPKKSPGGCSAGEIQNDYDRRLQKVRVDQEAIPI